MKSTGGRVVSRIISTIVFLFSFQYLVIVSQPLSEHFQTVLGVVALALPSVLCLLFTIICRGSFWMWVLHAASLGVAAFLAFFANENATFLINILLTLYIGGGYIVCLALIAEDKPYTGKHSNDDNYLNHMTGDESGGIDTTGLMP